MKPAALFAIPLAFVATITSTLLARPALAWTITACQTISQPGSYLLANNLSNTGGNCLVITASLVTIDLQGFSIIGQSSETAIGASADINGITVRNGSISGFANGVNLPGGFSTVERLVVEGSLHSSIGILANGIVKDNIVGAFATIGISAGGIVTGNYAVGNEIVGIGASAGSTVIGNSVMFTGQGLVVTCPSNVTNNTVTEGTLELIGTGCKNTNNVVGP
jgi:hypothetical protein